MTFSVSLAHRFLYGTFQGDQSSELFLCFCRLQVSIRHGKPTIAAQVYNLSMPPNPCFHDTLHSLILGMYERRERCPKWACGADPSQRHNIKSVWKEACSLMTEGGGQKRLIVCAVKSRRPVCSNLRSCGYWCLGSGRLSRSPGRT